jgi:hypothetical protein
MLLSISEKVFFIFSTRKFIKMSKRKLQRTWRIIDYLKRRKGIIKQERKRK